MNGGWREWMKKQALATLALGVQGSELGLMAVADCVRRAFVAAD
jgi:hypothetical protein